MRQGETVTLNYQGEDGRWYKTTAVVVRVFRSGKYLVQRQDDTWKYCLASTRWAL